MSGSRPGIKTPNPSLGPKLPMRSSKPSPHIFNAFLAQDTSHRCIMTRDWPSALPAGISTTASHPPSEACRIQATALRSVESVSLVRHD